MSNKIPQKDGTFKYECSYCHKVYVDPFKANDCRNSHGLVYLRISRYDLDRLLKFIYFKDDKLITDTMIESLKLGLKMKE